MPTFVPEEVASGPVIQALTADGGFRVDGAEHRAVRLTIAQAVDWSDAPALDALTEAELAPILDPAPEFVLIGTGATLRRPPQSLVAALDARGIGIEPMDSRAAARAWVILRGEDRVIAAALLPWRE